MKPLSRTTPRTLTALHTARLSGALLCTLLRDEIGELAARCAAPATADGPWLRGTISSVPQPDSWAVVVRDDDGLLRAAIVLVDETRDGSDSVALAGSVMGFRSTFLADSSAAASLLGHEFDQALRARQRSVRVRLGPLASDAAWLDDFVATVPGAEVFDTDPIPSVRRGAGVNAEDYLEPSVRRTLRKAHNRLAADQRQLALGFTREAPEICAMLPSLEQMHRERDHDQGRDSMLDDVDGRRMWQARLSSLALDRHLELATLHIDGDLAAQVIAIVDRAEYRVLEGILRTRWSRYSPGRVLEAAVLQRVLDDSHLESLDWMSSIAPESLLAANEVQPASLLRVDYPSLADR